MMSRFVASRRRLLCLTTIGAWLASLALSSLASAADRVPLPQRWEPRIRQYEAADARQSPPKHGIVFLGSSSIVGWDVKEFFPDLPVVARGFGGSHLSCCIHYAPRITLPYEPKVVVVYAGDNDIASGKSPERVRDDFKRLVALIHEKLPKTRIVFIAIKPSLARWKLVDKMREANRLVQRVTEGDERLVYLDIDAPMIGADGKPRAELFRDDGLHLNEKGYRLWSSLLRPHLCVEE